MIGDACFLSTAPASRRLCLDWTRAFAGPRWRRTALRLDAVLETLHEALDQQRQGRWLVLALAYEAAAAFDPRLPVQPPSGQPLVFAAAYDAPLPAMPAPAVGAFAADPWRPLVSRADYGRAIAALHENIRQGEVYQVNYAFPLQSRFHGDPAAWFAALAGRQQAGLCCRLDLGGTQLLSFSPELFFTRQGEQLTVRPMKGTLARGGTTKTDALQALALANCPKNQAENRMITDLMRNDLGRIARPGTVRVPELFAVQALGAVWQMTSTATAEAPRSVDLISVLTALFPCGSVTGAPKGSAMRLIRDLEPFPRGFYTGALGWAAPNGDCVFNVAIRTITLDERTGLCRFGVGGGVTHYSREAEEYEECRLKARFLEAGGQACSLLETLRLDKGRFAFEKEHLARLEVSAQALGFPFHRPAIEAALAQAGQASGGQRRRVRLLLGKDGSPGVELFPLPDRLERPAVLGLWPEPVDAADPTLVHKTTRRARYDRALAGRPDCDDVLLVNTAGQVTESCRANLVIRLGGRLLTPAAHCGVLPGTYRSRLLARGILAEAELTPTDLVRAEALWLINSVRLWTRAVLAPAPVRKC